VYKRIGDISTICGILCTEVTQLNISAGQYLYEEYSVDELLSCKSEESEFSLFNG